MQHSFGFQFKQFFIAHQHCAMKVNTDGILLGAAADIQQAKRILDLGTGSGLVAIMLAQRSNAQITALELEPNAAAQARQNAAACPWSTRITVLEQDVMAFEPKENFDLIVANPPYFIASLDSPDHARCLARSSATPHIAWLKKAAQWLNPTGKICFILPNDAAEQLLTATAHTSLHCSERCRVYSKAGKPPKRIIVTFGLTPAPCCEREITIYDEQNRYTPEFRRLTEAFYLHF